MGNHKETQLIELFERWAQQTAVSINPLPPSGSYREYYRIKSSGRQALAVYNPDAKENRAFIEFARHFKKCDLNVPQIYAENRSANIYLVEDLGDLTLFDYLSSVYKNGIFPQELIDTYKNVIAELPRFQIVAGKTLDYRYCYPRKRFDKRSMMWDLNYFKYYFLKLARVNFDEQELENDFQKFVSYLLTAPHDFFLYRDFQSRNVMLLDNKPYFIDFQGGRRGALQYDIASLLYDAKADIPQHIRMELLEEYIRQLEKYIPVNRQEFIALFWGFVLIRIMQAMGSYGFRGFYEKKEHFLRSIPYSIANLHYILNHVVLPVKIPTLWRVLNALPDSPHLKKLSKPPSSLKVSIFSFAYKRGIPTDQSGNGGGFVFDCRAILNPGRYEEFKALDGRHPRVAEFLENQADIKSFLEPIYKLIERSVTNYLERKFTHLMVNFGCTGGQHRSVYCAEKLAEYLKSRFDIQVEVRHRELE